MTENSPSHSGNVEAAAAVRRVTIVGLVMNLLLAGVKFIVGIVGCSQALVADAVHSLSDCLSDFAIIFGAPLWSAPADEHHPHGHGRIETLITLFIGVLLGSVGVGLAWKAWASMQGPPPTRPTWLVFFAACLSVLVKEGLYRWTVRVGQRHRSSATIANAWHHRSDALSSLPVAAAVLGAQIVPTWNFLDPIAAVLVGVLILHASWTIGWPALQQLIDRGATNSQLRRIAQITRETEGVAGLHGLRTRYVGPGLQIDMHVQVKSDLTVHEGHAISGRVKQRLLAQLPEVLDVLIHIEPEELVRPDV